ncbi:hypothetical protein BCR37DRAFT_37371 [Protomyces lactucae-debilis]|uniref:Uncharacterized protein n=1 Tax=Protomyces lactucae-debilis TaxID=2754530 RepID=A0A1Y2FH40_PROLT|nr:uncharacterized protein BCR37DRAFT_37371 [Protomyces lactucae-debilis]ORY82125.1 hypothetical protein BCR37DRAFT_37371 [Protomyces lactucae-debilis]
MEHRPVQLGAAEIWDTSKCMRILRPLKLKIMALQRTLTSSRSVIDGMTSWKDLSSTTFRPPSHSNTSDDFSDATYGRPKARMIKYGSRKTAIRKAVVDSVSTPEDLIHGLRASMPPHLSAAYVGVFEAYKGILERSNQVVARPSLASRAASAVGKCIVLTSEDVTGTPVDADEWYEATPAHLRTATMIGQACQTIVSHSEMLAPIMPALALCTAPHPLACEILEGLLSTISFTGCRKVGMLALQRLACQLGYPQLLQRHYAQRFCLSYFNSINIPLLTLPHLDEPLDQDTFALYKKMAQAGFDGCRRTKDDEAREAITSTLEEMATRTIQHGSETVLTYMADLYLSRPQRSGEFDEFQVLGMAHEVALLQHQSNSQTQLVSLQTSFRRLSHCSNKTQHIASMVSLFSQDQVVTLAELLVGRVDQLAVLLAYEAANQHQGDFVDWAIEVERSVMEAKTDSNAGRWRYEPLLDSWVASTPGVKKIKGIQQSMQSELDVDESTDETDYEADTSQHNFVIWDANADEKDLISPFQAAIKPLDLQDLSARRLQDQQASAKVLKRYKQLSYESCGMSPLVKRAQQGMKRVLDESDLMSSPIQATRKRSRMHIVESLPVADDSADTMPRSTQHRLRQTRSRPDVLVPLCDSPPKAREMRAPMRELKNLKSSFLSLRRKKNAEEPRRLATVTKTPLRQATRYELSSSDEEEEVVCPLSESDELSLL